MFYRPRHCGFTLVELIVAVSVLVILVTVAVPSFQSSLDKRRLIGAAEQVYSDVQWARGEAVRLNKKIVLTFKNSGTTNWCYGMHDAITPTCDCTASSTTNCTIGIAPNSVEKKFINSGFRGVSLTLSGFDTNNANYFFCVDSRRGKFFANASCGSDKDGAISLTSSSGTVKVDMSELGRVRLCSNTGVGGYPSCS